MTGKPEESHGWTVDARGAQGVQYNAGSGNNAQHNHYYAEPPEPSLDDDLLSLDSASQLAAYELFSKRSRDRKLALLAQSPRATELINALFAKRGAGRCAELLRRLRVDRAAPLLEAFPPEQRAEITIDMAHRLIKKDSRDDARTWVTEWADIRPERAVELLTAVAELNPAGGTGTGPRNAIELLPGGPPFLLGLPNNQGTQLLRLLLPQPSPGTASQSPAPARASDIDAFLGPLIELDPQRTATLMVKLDPRLAAAYLSQLRLKPGARLLRYLAVTSPDTRDELCRALPEPLLAALLKQITFEFPDVVLDRTPRSTGWPWIDATLAVLVCVGPAAARSTGNVDTFIVSAKREAENLRDVWRAARRSMRDLSYYRRQRNHLAVIAVVLAIALVTWIFL